MSDWIINKTERTVARWILSDGSIVLSGSAFARYWRQNGANKEWLQSDNLSWSTSLYEFSLTANIGEGFYRVFAIPASAEGFTVNEEVRHSNALYPLLGTDHLVSNGNTITTALEDLIRSLTISTSLRAVVIPTTGINAKISSVSMLSAKLLPATMLSAKISSLDTILKAKLATGSVLSARIEE